MYIQSTSLHQDVHYIRGHLHRVNRCTFQDLRMFIISGSSLYPGFIIVRFNCIYVCM